MLTSNLQLPIIEEAAAQKEVTINSSLLLLDDVAYYVIRWGPLADRPASAPRHWLWITTDTPRTIYGYDMVSAAWVNLLEEGGVEGLGGHSHTGPGDGGALAGDVHTTFSAYLRQGSTPGTPPAGYVALFVNSAGHVCAVDESDTLYDLTTGGAGGSNNAIDILFAAAGNIASTNVQAALEELDSEKAATAHVHAATAITNTPAGTIAATNVQQALNELDSEKSAVGHGHAGTEITNTPAGNISAVNVQQAINELDSEKAPTTHTHPGTDVNFTPTGGVSAVTIQGAIVELDAEKAPISPDYITGSAQSGLPNELVLGTDIMRRGTIGTRPAANTVLPGTHYFATDDNSGQNYRSTGSAWEPVGAPNNVSSAGTGHTVQENGSSLTQRTNLNFKTGIVAADNAGANATDIDVDLSSRGPADASYLVGAANGELSAELVYGTTVNLAGPIGSRPAANTLINGSTYLATDENGGTSYRGNGTAWVQSAAPVSVTGTVVWTRSGGGLLYPQTLADHLALGDSAATNHTFRVYKTGGSGTLAAPQAPVWIDQTIDTIDAGGGPDVGAINSILSYIANGGGIAVSDLVATGVDSRVTYGDVTHAARGTVHTFTSVIDYVNSASASNESANFFAYNRARGNPGTPCSIWMMDLSAHGPKDTQPGALMGPVSFVNNYYNGSPTRCESAGLVIVTRQGQGAGAETGHSGYTTYPVDCGLIIAGTSSSSDGRGFKKGIRIGGASASPWFTTGTSKIGRGLVIQDLSELAIQFLGTNTNVQWGDDADTTNKASIGWPGAKRLQVNDLLTVAGNAAGALTIGSASQLVATSILVQNQGGSLNLGVAAGTDQFLLGSGVGTVVVLRGSNPLLIGKDGANSADVAVETAGTSVPDGTLRARKGFAVGTAAAATAMTQQLVTRVNWDPPALPPGNLATLDVSFTGAATGDTVELSFSQALPDGASFTVPQATTNSVKVTLRNDTASTLDLPLGSLVLVARRWA